MTKKKEIEIDTSDKYKELSRVLTKKYPDMYKPGGIAYDKVQRISTDLVSLDTVLGGGIPIGRVIEIYGLFSCCKTTLCLQIVKAFQNRGLGVFWQDVEKCFDPEYAEACGVDVYSLGLTRPESAEACLDMAREIISSGAVSLIVIDSVAAMVPETEYEKDIGQSQMGIMARILSQSIKQIVSLCSKYNCTVIFINQLRSTNLMGYGPSVGTTGGKALEYYSSIRLELKKVETLGEKKPFGLKINIKTTKNKTARPFLTRDVVCYFLEDGAAGVDLIGDLLDYCIEKKVIKVAGSWFTFDENKIQGWQSTRDFIAQNPEIENLLRQRLNDNESKEEIPDGYDDPRDIIGEG